MLYLARSSRPDISYAVHQCDMVSHGHRCSSAVVIKYIARYLTESRHMDIIIKLTIIEHFQFNIYADADFVGLFASVDKADPISVKSRTCVLLTLGDVPIFWSSKL